MKKVLKLFKFLLLLLIAIILFVFVGILLINIYMINYSKEYILKDEEISSYNFECITVLGASVKADGTPSSMLKDRLDKAIILYYDNVSDKILMSGDHVNNDYDEVTPMKNYAISNGVVSSDVFLDHLGLNTYDSMYRLLNVYEVNKTVVVTQEYHLYRAIYIARKLGIEAYGVEADPIEYVGQTYRDVREILARVKDFFKVMIESKTEYDGETISIIGDGNSTNDR